MNEEQFKKLEAAVLSKKLKQLKDVIKEVSVDTEISIDDYKRLTLIATELGANPILKYIVSLVDLGEEFFSECFLVAIKNNKQKTIEYFLELGADINAVDASENNASIIAIDNGKLKLLSFLIEKGINLHKMSLISSVANNKAKIVDLLLDTNIDLNLVDENNNTALHHAILIKKSKIVEALVNKGVELNIENKDGLVPLALAWKLDSTPAILDLLINTQKTNLAGKAGLKIMKEAFKISKGRKKEQRRNMKTDYFASLVSKMTKEEFVAKHGAISKINTSVGDLYTPNDDGSETIMKGTFTNIGYFTREQDYENMKHNWEAIDYAIEFTNKITKILNDADCFAPNTEGGSPYEPFFIPEAGWTDLISFDSKPSQEALEASHGAYNKWPSSYDNYGNVFINDIKEHYEDDFIDEKQYNAFIEASKLMEENLKNTYNIQLYPDFIHFPWLFLGIDKYRNLVGVMTSAVWT